MEGTGGKKKKCSRRRITVLPMKVDRCKSLDKKAVNNLVHHVFIEGPVLF